MSDVSGGPGWWLASDGKWYQPEQHPNYQSPPPAPQPAFLASSSLTQPTPAPPSYGYPVPTASVTNGLAIASLVLSILWLAGIGSILAVIFAIRSRRQIRESRGAQGGDGIAIAGLVVGIVGIVGALPFVLVFALATTVQVTHTGAVVAACQADAASVETAAQAYMAQLGQWPASIEALTQTSTVNGQSVGPWLKEPPSTQNYSIFVDSQNGNVYVYPPSTARPSSFSQSNAFDISTGAPCLTVAS